MRPIIPALLLACLALTACDVAPIEPIRDATVKTDAFDPADTQDTSADAGPQLIACQPLAADTGCPAGMDCHTLAKVCTDCFSARARCSPDTGDRETCDKPVVLGAGQVQGGFFVPDPCPDGTACRASAFDATCEPIVCEAGKTACAAGVETTCDATGTVETDKPCPSGHACYGDRCQPIRHNVLVVFDTSGSMTNYIHHPGSATACQRSGTPCISAYPACDDPDEPLMLITLAKRVFADTLQATVGGFAQFALQRFPQRTRTAIAPNCWTGWYEYLTTMTDDDDAKDTTASATPWFLTNLSQVLVVPFPPRNTLDNTQQLLKWLDHVETLRPVPERPCTSAASCGGGLCKEHDGKQVCWEHDNPELRPAGNTPLGKSLFYAGEYFRNHVVIDGRPCDKDLDCASSGYVCDDGACRDPYRHCKDNHIVLFTDGAESDHTQETSFFNPAVQAKRLAFGLGCASDADCRGGALCDPSGVCLAKPTPCTKPEHCRGGAACVDGACLGTGQSVASVPSYVDPDGFQHLSAPDGSPISVKVSVVTLQATQAGSSLITANQRIALSGGGVHLDAHADDPGAMQTKLLGLMGLKAKCTALP